MRSQPDDISTKAPRRLLRHAVVAALAIMFVGAAIGFVGFLSQLRGAETKPVRNADGIVVLTGGSSRVSDAMELLADGYGKRLLISGVHPTNAVSDISRSLPDNQSLLGCCVDLDRSQHSRDSSTIGGAAANASQEIRTGRETQRRKARAWNW